MSQPRERPSAAELVEMAAAARLRAYCPYSGYAVGAAVLAGPPWAVFAGCNIENSAYSETICAERVALAKAVSEGRRDLRAIAVVGGGPEPPTPCGACLQVLAELAPEAQVYLAVPGGSPERLHLADLLPRPFRLAGR